MWCRVSGSGFKRFGLGSGAKGVGSCEFRPLSLRVLKKVERRERREERGKTGERGEARTERRETKGEMSGAVVC